MFCLFKRKNDLGNELGHYDILEYLHEKLEPKNYLEIGVQNGNSIILAKKCKKVIGVDPLNCLSHKINKNTKMFFVKSDDFFESQNVEKLLGGKIQLAFIDGMHLFEYVMRDFINVEKLSTKDTVVVLHDTIPFNFASSQREMCEGPWIGDVFKIILILKKYRPDLKLSNIVTGSIGTCIIQNLDFQNTILQNNYDKIFEEYINLSFNDIKDNLKDALSTIKLKNENKKQELENLLF